MPQPRGAHLLFSDKPTFLMSALRLRLSDFSSGLYPIFEWFEGLTSTVKHDLRILIKRKVRKKSETTKFATLRIVKASVISVLATPFLLYGAGKRNECPGSDETLMAFSFHKALTPYGSEQIHIHKELHNLLLFLQSPMNLI